MNRRWLCLAALAALPLTGCSTSTAETASPISFAPVAAGSSAAAAASIETTADGVEVAGPGTVCGSVHAGKESATVTITGGRVNCMVGLRVAQAYAAAAASSEDPVSLDTAGWRCTAESSTGGGRCASGANALSVG